MRVPFKNKLCVTCSVIAMSLALLSTPVVAFAGDGSGSMQVRASVTQKETQGSDEKPTEAPTEPAEKPTQPTQRPTVPTEEPTQSPKDEPTTAPEDKPTETPTEQETESITQDETTEASTKSTEVKTEPASKPRATEPSDTDVTVDEYGEVPVYGVVKRMNGYPFEILYCEELGIDRNPTQLYYDWHIGENQTYLASLEAKIRNGELTVDQALELGNNPANYPYPETWNYEDPRANTTSQEQIGTKQGVIGSKMEQYIDHYECEWYGCSVDGTVCDGYLTVDQYNASH